MDVLSVLEAAHHFTASAVQEGGFAIDATVGNGHDTVFLLRQIGTDGQVLGFDIQDDALDATRARVRSTLPPALADRLHLVQAGHEGLKDHLDCERQGRVDAVMFNLGYFPGGDHSVTTEPNTTRQALQASAEVLRPDGIISVVMYSGHEGGREEAQAVDDWGASLPQNQFQVLSYEFINQVNDPPRLLVVQKRPDASDASANSS